MSRFMQSSSRGASRPSSPPMSRQPSQGPAQTSINNPNDRGDLSPRKSPLPPSPTYSTHSGISTYGAGQGQYGQALRAVEGDRPRAQSFDVPRDTMGAGAASSAVRREGSASGVGGGSGWYASGQSRLGLPQGGGSFMGFIGQAPASPRKGAGGAGLYDTRLVSSTLSQVPPIPPLSPNPTGGSGLSHQSSSGALALGYTTSQNGGTGTGMGGGAGGSALGTSAGSGSASGSSVLHPSRGALPRGSSTSPIMFPGRPGSSAASASMMGMSSASASASALTAHGEILRGGGVRSVKETLAHSSPSSPWSLLTIHALPVFAGSALKSSIEDLNQLCHNHIVASSQRTAASRLAAVLSSDMRDLVSSGMLTLKSRLEGDDARLLERMAETWWFFWTHVISYIEGIFLPFSQLQNANPTGPTYDEDSPIPQQPVPVRHIILSGYLVHILLPLLPRINSLVASPLTALASSSSTAVPNDTTRLTNARDVDLQRILQMSLVLSTQAAYSSFYPFSTDDAGVAAARDYEVSTSVVELSKIVRRRIDGALSDTGDDGDGQRNNTFAGISTGRAGIQRKVSMLGRRRKGWRVSAMPDLDLGALSLHPNSATTAAATGAGPSGRVSRQQSEVQGEALGRWGQPNDFDEDDDDPTPINRFAPIRRDTDGSNRYGEMADYGAMSSAASAAASSATATASGTWRDASRHWDENTPQAQYTDLSRARARAHSASAGLGKSDEATPNANDLKRAQRV